jgi:chromosome segregation ATPase
VGHPTQGQPQQPAFSSSDSDVHAEHCTSPFQKATPGELDHAASLRITRDRTPDPNDLPSLLSGINDKPRRVLGEDDDSEGSAEHDAKLVAPNASEKEAARSEDERIADLERQLSETLAERAQLTDQLAEKRALLEQAEANVAQAKIRAHDLQAKVDELLLSRDQAEANAAQVKKRAGSEQRELQAKFDELLLSRDQALEQAQSASQKELTEVHAKLEASESELAAVRLRLTDGEVGWAKSKAEADTLLAGTQAGAGLVNMDVDRVMRRLMERVRSVEAEMASLRGNEKSIGEMECRNEG